MSVEIPFETQPDNYHHWKLSFDGDVATLAMDVNEDKGQGDYTLKLNSYDISVDFELKDAVERIRFEHPEVKSVIVTGGKDKIFCAGANIFMLGASSHAFKVNFCKYTNETRLYIEDASAHSDIKFLAALNGTASGGGYELALACDEIMLIDDRNSAVSFPEVPLLGVLPGTGGLTRITDKRMMRRDLADFFSTIAEGVKGKRAVDYKLVDAVVPKSQWNEKVQERAKELAAMSKRPGGQGLKLESVAPKIDGNTFTYRFVTLITDPVTRTAELLIKAPEQTPPVAAESMFAAGNDLWALRCYRELDDAILRLRFNDLEIGMVTVRTSGSTQKLLAAEAAVLANKDDWFVNEVLQLQKRVLKRLDVTSRTFLGLVEPGSCWAGSFTEILWCCDRSYLLDDPDAEEESKIFVSKMSDGALPMGNGLTRLQTRFYGDEAGQKAILKHMVEETAIDAVQAEELGAVTFVRDDIDFPDEVRLFIEERTAMSPDALTGMEANLRWPGPETMETRIFGRLSAWQNWIFTRDNATGKTGALTRYGSPERAEYDMRRC